MSTVKTWAIKARALPNISDAVDEQSGPKLLSPIKISDIPFQPPYINRTFEIDRGGRNTIKKPDTHSPYNIPTPSRVDRKNDIRIEQNYSPSYQKSIERKSRKFHTEMKSINDSLEEFNNLKNIYRIDNGSRKEKHDKRHSTLDKVDVPHKGAQLNEKSFETTATLFTRSRRNKPKSTDAPDRNTILQAIKKNRETLAFSIDLNSSISTKKRRQTKRILPEEEDEDTATINSKEFEDDRVLVATPANNVTRPHRQKVQNIENQVDGNPLPTEPTQTTSSRRTMTISPVINSRRHRSLRSEAPYFTSKNKTLQRTLDRCIIQEPSVSNWQLGKTFTDESAEVERGNSKLDQTINLSKVDNSIVTEGDDPEMRHSRFFTTSKIIPVNPLYGMTTVSILLHFL